MKAQTPATVKTSCEPKLYPDRLCHLDYTAHPHRCGCLGGDDEAQRRFNEYRAMTNPPTIADVLRGDLELVLTYGCSTDASKAAWEKLRALLDAPVESQGLASPLSDTAQAQLIAICRGAAQRCDEQHAYMAAASSDPHNWFPHKWVMDAMRSLLQVNARSQQSTINQLQARIEELERERGQPVDKWLDMASAPRDGTMVRLLVEFEEHSTEDVDQAPTIGANNFDNDGEDRWQFAGWCWSHDHFVEGKGVPVGWLPFLHVQVAPAALPDGYCIMPRSLTAENGAKALLLGEFKVTVTKECPECAELDDQNEQCEICDGEGQYSQSHTISWDQIKFIYSKAVGGLSLSPGSAELQAARFAKLDRLRGEALTFTYKHPSTTERRSVSLSRAEVAEGMEATLYEKLVAQLCQCESVGEANVIDCNCHQYGHDFERVAETDTEGSAV